MKSLDPRASERSVDPHQVTTSNRIRRKVAYQLTEYSHIIRNI
jgi:hypothetical protein